MPGNGLGTLINHLAFYDLNILVNQELTMSVNDLMMLAKWFSIVSKLFSDVGRSGISDIDKGFSNIGKWWLMAGLIQLFILSIGAHSIMWFETYPALCFLWQEGLHHCKECLEHCTSIVKVEPLEPGWYIILKCNFIFWGNTYQWKMSTWYKRHVPFSDQFMCTLVCIKN